MGIQPRVGNTQYVTEYTVKTSLDNKSWQDREGKFTGVNNKIVENRFKSNALVRARYVRIVVKKWGGHISLRADVLVAVGQVSAVTEKFVRAGVPENKRTYSSIWDNNKIGTGHARSMINSPQAWSAKTNAVNQWMQMDLGSEQLVAGTVIQPRVGNTQYVTKYTVKTSLDGKNWQDRDGTFNGVNNKIVENRFK